MENDSTLINIINTLQSVQHAFQEKMSLRDNPALLTTDEKTQLVRAIKNADIEGLNTLKDNGFDFSKEHGYALAYSAYMGNKDVFQHLVENMKVNIHADNDSAFDNAIIMNHNDIAEFIINKGLTHNVLATGLGEAATQGNIDLVKAMTDRFPFSNNELATAFDMACINEREDIATHLYSKVDDSYKEKLERSLEHWASWKEGGNQQSESDKTEYQLSEKARALVDSINADLKNGQSRGSKQSQRIKNQSTQ